jgi:hypothetical protein
MSVRDLLRNPRLALVAAALVSAIGVVGWTVGRAVRVDAVEAAPPPRFAEIEAVGGQRAAPPIDVRGAVELNPFSPSRSAPARRYRLSGWEDESPAAPPPPRPVVLGTAYSTPEQSFAIAKVGDGRPTVVRAGDILAGYTVRTIERGHVVFTSQTGERFEIRSNRQD